MLIATQLSGFGGGGRTPDFPVVEGRASGTDATNTSSHTVDLPAGVTSGDILVVFFTHGDNSAHSYPGGWTKFFEAATGTSRASAAWKQAVGGETSITVTTGSVDRAAWTSYRVSGGTGGTPAQANTGGIDPPNLTPSWGEKKTLWLASVGYPDGTRSVTGAPSGFTNKLNPRIGNINESGQASAERKLEAASLNPTAFTFSAGTSGRAATIAIEPR